MTRTFGDFHRQWAASQPELPGIVPAQAPPQELPPVQPHAGLRIGALVECAARDGLFRPCRCGSSRFIVRSGVGPHAAQMICDGCARGGRWVPKHRLAESVAP
jgi:hypothetical protein